MFCTKASDQVILPAISHLPLLPPRYRLCWNQTILQKNCSAADRAAVLQRHPPRLIRLSEASPPKLSDLAQVKGEEGKRSGEMRQDEKI